MDNVQRIFFVAPTAYILSGLAIWLDYLEPGLRVQGREVVVGLVAGPRFHLPKRYVAAHPHQEWLPIYCGTGTAEGRVRAVCRAIAKVRPDLVVSVNIPDAILAVARLRRAGWRNRNLRVAMAVHGIQPDLCQDMSTLRALLDGVVCTNRLACELAAVVGRVERSRIYYAPCGVEIPVSRKKGAKEDGRLRIAWIGRLEQEQKRVHDLVEITRNLADRAIPFTLVVAGTGPEETLLKEQLGEAVARGQVVFPGYLSPDDLRQQVFENIDLLLLTSSWETGPLVIWEAMAHRIAVVSSTYVGSGLEGALHHRGNALLFEVGDTRGATDCLESLARDQELRQTLASQGKNLVQERYSIEASVRNWHRAFAEIGEGPPVADNVPEVVGPPAGRLDRFFGPRVAEGLRVLMRTRIEAGDPSGEWPHTLSGQVPDEEGFWVMARKLDRRA